MDRGYNFLKTNTWIMHALIQLPIINAFIWLSNAVALSSSQDKMYAANIRVALRLVFLLNAMACHKHQHDLSKLLEA